MGWAHTPFVTSDGMLGLIDVTGGNEKIVKENGQRLLDWVEEKYLEENVRGLVLAPLTEGDIVAKGDGPVQVVRGAKARELLGALPRFVPG